jgi:hypothetical protein
MDAMVEERRVRKLARGGRGKSPGGGSSPRRLARAACLAWAVLLAALTVRLGAGALGPLLETWDLGDIEQAGQLTVYNAKALGGEYGHPVELGDCDGDGHIDVIMAPMRADAGPIGEPAAERPEAGEVYVYPGDGRLEGVLDRASFGDSPPGLTIWGARPGDLLGTEVFTFDVNGDEIEDLIMGAQNYDGPDEDCSRVNAGGVFVVFGRPGLLDESSTLDLALAGGETPPEGVLTVVGAAANDRLGIWVEAGDIDGDGLGDLLLGADQAPSDSPLDTRFQSGMVVVIYGRSEFPPVIDLATDAGTLPGVSRILGRDQSDHFGSTLHSRDLNGDGRDELIAAAALNRLSAGQPGPACSGGAAPIARAVAGGDGPANNRAGAGEVFVFFGPAGGGRLPPLIDLAAPLPAGVAGRVAVIHGAASGDFCGEEITTGDFNGDGFYDLVLGALTADSPLAVRDAGMAHVIYWHPGMEGVEIDLSPSAPGGIPAGVDVSSMFGVRQIDIFGDTLSAADFNNDGLDDLAVAVPHSAVSFKSMAGLVTIVLGREEPWPPSWAPQGTLPAGLTVAFIVGADEGDLMSYSMEARDYDGDGYGDLFPNAMRGSGAGNASVWAGEAYLVSGYHLFGMELRITLVTPPEGLFDRPTAVMLTGSGFTTDEDTRLFVGGVEITERRVLDGGRIEATIPPSAALGAADVRVETQHGSFVLGDGFFFLDPLAFIRSDSNLDLALNLTDALVTLNALFLGDGVLPCPDAADANDDGLLDVSDPVYGLNHLFLGGRLPPAPFPSLGRDPSADDLGCR